jgi:hypothetical protein
MKRWDGTRLGAEELCAWANEGLHPFDEPLAEYDSKAHRLIVDTDYGPLEVLPWDLVYRTDDAMGVERSDPSCPSCKWPHTHTRFKL